MTPKMMSTSMLMTEFFKLQLTATHPKLDEIETRFLVEAHRRDEERLRLIKERQEIVEMLDCHPNNVLHSIRDLQDRLGE